MSDILNTIDATLDAVTGRCTHCGGQLSADTNSSDLSTPLLRFPAGWRDEDVARFKEAFLAAAHRPPRLVVLPQVRPARPPWWRRLLHHLGRRWIR